MKNNQNNINLIIFLAFALPIIILIFYHPKNSPVTWILLGFSLIAGIFYKILEMKDNKQAKIEWQNWNQKINNLLENWDIVDDGHLFEQFDRNEWERICNELERSPKDQRSLKKAILSVDPEFIN